MDANEQIPSFDLRRNYAGVRGEILEAVSRVLDSQQFIMGEDVAAFEEEVSLYLGAKHAITCASGTDALLLAMMTLDLRPGDEVITTPFSFFATASCIARAGARPVFADVSPDTFNVLPDRVADAITDRTRAFIPVHLFGQAVLFDEIAPLLASKGITVVEDCAQAFGSHSIVGGSVRRAGTAGAIGCFSFFPTKNLGAYGDAGMLSTDDDATADRLRLLRLHGAKSTYLHEEIGLNSRMDSIQAAILRVRLRHIEEWTEQRREAAGRYDLLFAQQDLCDVVQLPAETPNVRHTYHQYTIRAKDRDGLQRYLAEHGIVSRVYYPVPLHLQPCFAELGYKKGSMPNAERICEEVLSLPMFPELTEAEQSRVVRAIADFYGRASS